ncbi:MAG TPA: CvpA family protein [Candidatus Omnitrophota bacterium]|nr:CvpA family protein [Candidatus Omnitrophota bacterium]
MTIINWVDLIMIVLFGLGVNSGRKSDFFTELIILLGVLFANCVSVHYYVRLGHVLNQNFVLPPDSQEVLAFIILAGTILGLTLLAKGGWLVILKIHLNRHVDNWGALIFSIIKSYFLCGLVLFALVISGHPPIKNASRQSLSFIILKKTSLSVYSAFYAGFIGHLFSEEPLNQKAFRLMQEDR